MANITLVGGEPRARHMYVRDGAINETVAIWREFLGDKADVFSRDEIIAAGHFGPDVSLDSRERMGDLVAIAKGELILVDPSRIKEECKMVGHHGGLEAIEVAIPLLTHQN
jgi:cytosine/adenosine deaminase-related metal-dependent hydrolase